MGSINHLLLILVLIASLIGIPSKPTLYVAVSAPAYVDPTLLASNAASLAVIVTAEDGERAAAAVQAAGGRVTGDLWLIDGVAATLPAHGLAGLAAIPGIRSIVADQQLEVAQAPDGNTNPWDGYVSRRLTHRKGQLVGGTSVVGVAPLENGGAVALGNDGSLVFYASDGFESARQSLKVNRFSFPPSTGSGMVAAVIDNRLSAFNSDGSPLWMASIASNEPFSSPATIHGGRIFVTGANRWIYAYEAATGALAWRTQVDGKHLGTVVGSPSVGSNGTIFVAFTGEGSPALGHLYALDSQGAIRFHMMGDDNHPFVTGPLAAQDGTVFVTSKRRVYAVNGNGSLRYRFELPDDIQARPALGPNNNLFVSVKSDRLISIDSGGSLRFTAQTGGNLQTAPALSPDGSRVYAAKREKQLLAFDASTGARLWSFGSLGDLSLAPVVDANGVIHLTDVLGNYTRLAQDGSVLFSLAGLPAMLSQTIVSRDGDAFMAAGNTISRIGKLPKQWVGRPDVQDIGEKKVWDLANPFVIDIGADLLHSYTLPDGKKVDGAGVTVAVLDSGVYFDDQVKTELGTMVQKLFVGQADFVNRQCEVVGSGKKSYVLGMQFENHCFADYYTSKDVYGHGTHVAGAIWDNLTDWGTNTFLGVAPQSRILSVRVLDAHGNGTYANAIEGIQYVVQHKAYYDIRVLNLSLSATPTTPYFVDPLNRAVMAAWAAGITVVAAAGNVGPLAESVTVPGNNPYVITVGALDSKRTPGYWTGDLLPRWSATGPTFDGFLKPDVLAPGSQIVSFMYNDHTDSSRSARLVQEHPDYTSSISLFRMNGTSMATAITSGVVALILQLNPGLTPDQVKYRLQESSLPALTPDIAPLYNILQQGMGRIWAPMAVFGEFPAGAAANQGMDVQWDLSNGYATLEELSGHYQGPARKMLSDDGATYLYYLEGADGKLYGLGMADAQSGAWLDAETIVSRLPTWSGGQITLNSGMNWTGGVSLSAGLPTWSGGLPLWSGGMGTWAGGMGTWAGGMGTWAGGFGTWAGGMGTWAGRLPTWSGGMNWAGGMGTWAGGFGTWAGHLPTWSGGMGTWAGGFGTWAGGMAWAGGMGTWAGGMGTWAGGLPAWSNSTASSSLGANEWVDDDDAYEGLEGNGETPPTTAPVEPTPESTPAPQMTDGSSNGQERSVRVRDIDNHSYWRDNSKWLGVFAIGVEDNSSALPTEVQVTVDFSVSGKLIGTAVCVTNQEGICVVASPELNAKKIDHLQAEIRNLSLAGYIYTADANYDNDGDSNGTVITSFLPLRTQTGATTPNGVEVSGATAIPGGDQIEKELPQQTLRLFLPTVGK